MKRAVKAMNKNNIEFSVVLSIVLVIIFNNETLPNNLSSFRIQPTLLASLYVIALFIWRLIRRKQLINVQTSMIFIFMLILIFLSFYIDGVSFSTTNAYYLLIMSLIVGFSISQMCNINQFLIIYSDTIYIISIASILFTYLFKSVIISMPALFPIVTNSAGTSFTNAYITYIIRYHDSFRNYGIFREPGVFAIFIVIAIAYQLKKENVNILKLIILIIALITTFSTPGYIALILLVIGNFNTRQINLEKNKNNFKIIIVTSILIAINWIFSEGSDNIVDMFSKININHSSYGFRVQSIIRNIEVWIMNPIFGSGITSGNILLFNYQGQLYSLSSYHNTSTLTALLVFFGAGYTLLFFIFLFKYCRIVYPGLVYVLAMILLLNSQLLIYNPIIYTLIMYGAKQKSILKN